MPVVTTNDRTELYVKDWGAGRPVVLIHGWPLSADSWEHQAMALAEAGYRVIAYDRRGFGRSGQPWGGYDYDTMSDDLAKVIEELGLTDATIAGFSMGGGEVARYMSRHGGRGVKQAALISSIAPFMGDADGWPGVGDDVIQGIRDGLKADRPSFLATFFKDFFGEGTEGGGVSDEVRHWAWMQAMWASPKATLDCVDAFATTDLRPDMAAFEVPTLVIHGDADKTVPIDATGRKAAEAVSGSEFKVYEGAPHAVTSTHAERLTKDLLAFLGS